MAIGLYFDGRRLIRPQAVSKIDDSGMYGRGLGGGNTLALIGECTGGEPQKVLWFTDPSYAKSVLRSGNLLTAIQRAYDPSSETPGAYLVAAIRVNPAVQAKLNLTDASGNPLATFTSVDYGIWNNQVKMRLENATTTGKKVTFTYGSYYDQGDDVVRQSLYLGCTDPLQRTATCTITNGSLTKTLVTNVVGNFYKVWYETGGVGEDKTTAAKEADGSYVTTALDTNKYIYFGSDQPFTKINFVLGGGGVVNSVVTSLVVEFGTGTSTYTTLTPTADTTTLTGAPLGQAGYITFTQPTTWVRSTYEGISAYWIRISSAATLTGGSQFDQMTLERGLTVALSSYSTIQQLVDYLDAQSHYEAGVITSKPDSEYSTHLDEASSVSIAGVASTVTSGPYTPSGNGTSLPVSSTSGFTVGDYITISVHYPTTGTVDVVEETRTITSISTGILVMNSSLSVAYASGAYVREARIFNSDVQSIIDWVNNGNTSYVTAAYPATTWVASTNYSLNDVVLPSTANDRCYVCTADAGSSGTTEPSWPTVAGQTVVDSGITWTCKVLGRGTLQNIPDTYLTGGSEGTTTQAYWDSALNLLQTEDVHLISCISYDPAVWSSVSTHCSYMSGVGKKERIGFCGGFATADGYTNGYGKWVGTSNITNSINKMIAYALTLNSDRMVYVGPGFYAYDEDGNKVLYPGSIAAAMVAGMAAGVDVAEALTHDSVKVIGLEYNLRWADLDRLLEGGVLPLEYDPGRSYRVCQSITTWLKNDKFNRREVSVRRTADYVSRQVRERLEMDFIGAKGTKTTLISIKNATISVLQQMVRLELLAGDETNPAYKNIQVRMESGEAAVYVDFECSPVIPINYIPITVHLTVYTATLTA